MQENESQTLLLEKHEEKGKKRWRERKGSIEKGMLSMCMIVLMESNQGTCCYCFIRNK